MLQTSHALALPNPHRLAGGRAMSDASLPSVILAREPGFALGDLAVRPATREVEAADFRDVLEPRVMQVLVALAQAQGRVVTRDDLTMRCWEGRVVGEDAINRVIARLRRLSQRDGGKSFALETITKVGYRLAAAPSQGDLPARRSAPSLPNPPAPILWRSYRPLIVACFALLSFAALVLLWQPWLSSAIPENLATDYATARAAMERHTAEDSAQAVVLMVHIVERAPYSADAWAALGLAYYCALEFTPPESQQGIADRAAAAADHALMLEPGHADAGTVHALLVPAVGNWSEADRLQAAALERAPDQRELLTMRGFFLAGSGRTHDSLAYFARANTLPPPVPRTVGQFANFLAADGQLVEADRLLDDSAQAWPRNLSIYFTRFWMNVFSGRADKALAIIDDTAARPTGVPVEDFVLYRAAALAFVTKDPADIAEALRRHGKAAYLGRGYASNSIRVAAALGDLDLAFALAEALFLDKGGAIPPMMFSGSQGQYGRVGALPVFILFHPSTAAMREDPRFVPLVEALGLGAFWRSSGRWPDFCRNPEAATNCATLRAGK